MIKLYLPIYWWDRHWHVCMYVCKRWDISQLLTSVFPKLYVKYRLKLAAWALSQWIEETGLCSANRESRGQRNPQVAPCGGQTQIRDRHKKNYVPDVNPQFCNRAQLWYEDQIMFIAAFFPSLILASSGGWSLPLAWHVPLTSRALRPLLPRLGTIYIYLCVFTPGNFQTRVYLGYWNRQPTVSLLHSLDTRPRQRSRPN